MLNVPSTPRSSFSQRSQGSSPQRLEAKDTTGDNALEFALPPANADNSKWTQPSRPLYGPIVQGAQTSPSTAADLLPPSLRARLSVQLPPISEVSFRTLEPPSPRTLLPNKSPLFLPSMVPQFIDSPWLRPSRTPAISPRRMSSQIFRPVSSSATPLITPNLVPQNAGAGSGSGSGSGAS